MLGSISPVGEAARGQRWWLTVSAYVVASTIAGSALGLLLGAAGAGLGALAPLTAGTRLAVLAGVALLGAAVDSGLLAWRYPTWRRQVDERWLGEYRGWVYGAGFGLQLGSAVATIIPAAVTYVALAAAALAFSWQSGLIIGAVFGLVRSLPVLLTARLRTAPQLYAATRRIEGAQPLAGKVAIAGQVLVATAGLVLVPLA